MSVVIDCGTGIETAGTPPSPPPLIERFQARLAALADIRWQHEVGGITIDWEGQQLPIKTERADRTEAFIAATLAGQRRGDHRGRWTDRRACPGVLRQRGDADGRAGGRLRRRGWSGARRRRLNHGLAGIGPRRWQTEREWKV
jgi:hypothetical protein